MRNKRHDQYVITQELSKQRRPSDVIDIFVIREFEYFRTIYTAQQSPIDYKNASTTHRGGKPPLKSLLSYLTETQANDKFLGFVSISGIRP